jgi:hypothetical protein
VVSAVNGDVLGFVELKNNKLFGPIEFKVLNEARSPVLRLQADKSGKSFKLLRIEGEQKLGSYKKTVKGEVNEKGSVNRFSMTCNLLNHKKKWTVNKFYYDFLFKVPRNLSVTGKATLIGAMFFIVSI